MGPKPAEETERCVMEPCSMAYGTSFGDSSAPAYNNGGGDRWAKFLFS